MLAHTPLTLPQLSLSVRGMCALSGLGCQDYHLYEEPLGRLWEPYGFPEPGTERSFPCPPQSWASEQGVCSGPDHRYLTTVQSLCFSLNAQGHFLTLPTVSEVLFKVYCVDHTYTTIRVPVAASVKEVISAVADKLSSGEGLLIVKMNSGGGNSLD